MTLAEAVVLGLVQGLTEFLPISSTAHLRIVPSLLGWEDPGAAFSAVIQIGTLVAVLAYFRRDIVRITTAVLRRQPEGRLGWMIAVGTVPIVVLGLIGKDLIETSLRSLYVISASLIGLAIVLWIAERVGRRTRDLPALNWGDALIVGGCQALALVPGTSRSGATIAAGLFRGLTRETAARFSFLLSLPAVFGAGVYQLVSDWDQLFASNASGLNLATATVVSAAAGYATIAFLLGYLKNHGLYLFIVYRLVLGFGLLLLLATGRLQAF